MQGPWYTFDEAQELLSFNRSELLHQIDTGAIRPVVTTKQRSFLVFTRDANKRWLGLGTCRYRGCLSLHPNTITNLLENEEIHLSTGSGIFLEPEKATNWNAHYPFKQQPPFDAIKKWDGRESGDVDLSRCAATPLPEERASNDAVMSKMMTGFNSFIDTLASSKASGGQQVKTVEDPYLSELAAKAVARPAMLDFKKNSLFKLDDLRIPASEIEKFNEPISAANDTEPKAQAILAPRLAGKRISQLHELIFSALVANPAASAKVLWDLIQQDSESETPLYDQDGIISIMDTACIEWSSRNGIEQSMKWASFEERVSKLRKQLPS